MVGRRKQPDGLPARLYARQGKRWTVYYIKAADNTNEELTRAQTADAGAVRLARAKAIEEYGRRAGGSVEDLAWLIDEYFRWQSQLVPDTKGKKAASTIAENKREAENLKLFFGAMLPDAIQPHHCYAYIDERIEASGAGVKAGKEISLLAAVLEYGRRRGKVRDNVARGVEKPRNAPSQVRVTWEQVQHLVEVGRAAGGSYAIQALAAQFAWLTLRRSTEVRAFTQRQIAAEGCTFVAAKRKGGEAARAGLIEWSPLLRATVDEALALKRWQVFGGARLLFGNLAGEPYTRSGWKSIWGRLHDKAEAQARELGLPWQRFSLQDCRPGGVTEKQERGDADTVDATLHADARMVATVYDRRRVRKAKPAL